LCDDSQHITAELVYKRREAQNQLSYNFIYFALDRPTGKICDRSMMIVYRPIEITDLILELLAGMRSYTGNVDLDTGASCKYSAMRQRSHQCNF